MVYQPQIVIIGAGIVGLSTAYALLEMNMSKVCILEQESVNHSRASSASLSRLLRFEYGADPFYSDMVKRSLELWKDLERKSKKTLYTQTGVLSLGKNGDDTLDAYKVLNDLGLSSEHLSHRRCRQRFPQFEVEDYEMLTYNPEGGILHASTCLQTLKRVVSNMGGTISEFSRVNLIEHENPKRSIRLKLSSGEEILADRIVVALGPWVHHLLNQLYLPVELTRQYLLYFSGLSPTTFGLNTLPAFMDHDLYGFPIHRESHGWLKAASHKFGPATDPDGSIQIEEQTVEEAVQKVRSLLPALREARLAHIEACIYDVSPDEDFILDYLPDDPRITFATGLSGHGFKFGPLLGRLLSSLVCETSSDIPLGRFRLARFSHQHEYRKVTSVA